MAQQINTVIVLRNDKSTAWETSTYKLLEGEVGISYLDNGNVIAKLGDGEHTWADLPQIEGVFEKELTLTHNFGRYKTSNGFVKTTNAKGKTISEWLEYALSETKEPTITPLKFELSASAPKGEVGSYINTISWSAKTCYGKYEYGPATNLSYKNRSWTITNNYDDQEILIQKGANDTTAASTSNNNTGTYSGSFSLADGLQLTKEGTNKYAEVYGAYSLDATNAAVPVNNVGAETTGKFTDKSGSLTAEVKAEGYRKPFYGVLEAGQAVDINNLTSDVIRGLPNSGTATRGLPGSIAVPAGSQMVIFAAKAGTYSSLTATDDKAMNATVTFEKKANAVRVKGANNYVTSASGDAANGELYDIWYVDWGAGIGSAKQLTLAWV